MTIKYLKNADFSQKTAFFLTNKGVCNFFRQKIGRQSLFLLFCTPNLSASWEKVGEQTPDFKAVGESG
jgi:hypothetical protein